MKLVEYKNFLESRNIKLYDCQYRISYHKLLNQNSIYGEQTGGGSLIKKLNNLSNEKIHSIVNLLLSSNNYYIGFFLN